MAGGALDQDATAPRPRARSRKPTATSRRSISPSRAMPKSWAERLRGRVLPTGTVRTIAHGAISLLPGFTEGAWWVQDAAAALPARLLGDVRGKAVADLCAAPGGKTAQLALRRRARHRGRSLGRAARPPARESGAACAAGRDRRRRCAGMARRAVRRRAARCALLLDRHHPPPSRRALAQERSRPRRAHVACSSGCSTARSTCSSPAPRWSIASARWSRRKARTRSRPCWRATRASPASRLRRRRCSATPNSSPRTATCARCRCICPIPIRAGAGSMASMPPGSIRKAP